MGNGWCASAAALPTAGACACRTRPGAIAWYRTRFTLAEASDYALRFESVNHRARVWLDGKQVAQHTGAYLPFEARRRLTAGAHVLVVRTDFRYPEKMRSSGWFRSWFNFGGINREVTLRRLGASEIDAPGVRTRLVGGGGSSSWAPRSRRTPPARATR